MSGPLGAAENPRVLAAPPRGQPNSLRSGKEREGTRGAARNKSPNSRFHLVHEPSDPPALQVPQNPTKRLNQAAPEPPQRGCRAGPPPAVTKPGRSSRGSPRSRQSRDEAAPNLTATPPPGGAAPTTAPPFSQPHLAAALGRQVPQQDLAPVAQLPPGARQAPRHLLRAGGRRPSPPRQWGQRRRRFLRGQLRSPLGCRRHLAAPPGRAEGEPPRRWEGGGGAAGHGRRWGPGGPRQPPPCCPPPARPGSAPLLSPCPWWGRPRAAEPS